VERIATNLRLPADHSFLLYQEVFKALSDCGIDSVPVQLASIVYGVVERITHVRDPFEKEKERSNKIALGILSHLEKTILFKDHSLSFFALMSVLANQIDMGAYNVDLTQLEQRFLHSLNHSAFFEDRFREFESALQTAKTLLYILDNAGEVVFDLIFMREIKKKYPQIEISAAYRSRPMINDVTEKDLASIEPRLCEGIHFFDSGSPYPGILFPEVNEAFKEHFEHSYLILSKGQGNLEGLFDIRKPSLYFGLMVKCASVANLMGIPVGSLVFTQ
jgi:uncharacterized protein with ATP-grasp and redox domains